MAGKGNTYNASGPSSPHPDAFIPANTLLHVDQDDSQIPDLEETAKLQSTVLFPHIRCINHPKDQILRDPKSAVKTREMAKKSSGAHTLVSYIHKQKRMNHKDYENCLLAYFVSQMEPKKKVWRLVDLPYGKKAIGTKWVYRNKKDKRGIVVTNKARLVVQGHRQEERIDYDEVFASVARIEAIRIFLAFASFIRFIVSQMDVKSAFLYGTIVEEVYVSQPPGFIDPQFPNKVYKVEKALYGLHQAPKAWYLKGQPKLGLWYPRDSPFDLEAYLDSDYAGANLDRKSTTGEYVAAAHCCGQVLWIQNEMLDYGFNFMNTKIYIDNESTICIMSLSAAGFSLYCWMKLYTASTIVMLLSLVSEASMDLGMRLMISIGFLMFVDQHNMVACLEKTEENAEFHQIVYYLTTCSINYALIVSPTIYASYIEQFWNTAISKTVNLVKQIHVIVDGKAVGISKSSVRSDLLFNYEDAHIEQILPSLSTYQRKHRKTHKPRKAKKVNELPQTSVPLDIGVDKAVYQEEGDSVERAITTDASLEIGLSDRPRRQENTLGVQMLILGHTPESDEGRPNLLKLMNICTKLSNSVLALEEAKTIQDKVITRLKLRVRRLEKKKKARTSQPMKRRLFKGRVETSTNKSLGEDASKQRRNDDQTDELNLTNEADTKVIIEEKGSGEKSGCTADQVSTSRPEVSAATPSTPPPTTTIFGDEDLTIAQTLIKIRSEKAKEKGVAFRDVEEPPRLTGSTTTLQPLLTINPKDKARMDTDHELAIRMTHEKQEMYTIKERARLLVEYFKRRKKQLAAERAKAIKNKPPTRTQVKNMMITYLKHMDDFVPMDSEKEEKKSVEPKSKDKKGKRIKRVADSVPKQKSSKKQKMMQ
uniref:Putative ribonuclease H-like domain-containing protein n=1 Tax=Tanacetum cinerariifolium TaxID=118510 RepID=A0A6L2LJE3_TANCI|nr:putative ribonuclease H-like domain-containing protein [Tanacetum cinerariifolium]GEV14527.1 putative ribonuclease H-like domain-containing protein [Tanacetum cinerariifolium]